MGKFNDITGQKFNRLTAVKIDEERTKYEWDRYHKGERPRKPSYYWIFDCDCGNTITINGSVVKNGVTKSCGCLMREKNKVIGERSKKYNTYDLSGSFGIGYTFNGGEFYFDLEYFDLIKNYCWYRNTFGYIRAYNPINRKSFSMHEFIFKKYCDHINRIPYDNRMKNLRECTKTENARNKNITNSTSGIVGVSYRNNRDCWRAYITIHGKQMNLGHYKNKEDAIVARLKAEKEYFEEFAPQTHLFKQYSIV